MKLTSQQRKKIVGSALAKLNKPRTNEYDCVDFVREVYASVRITVPFPLIGKMNPPAGFNITEEKLLHPIEGEIIFLRRKNDKRDRIWTHLVITLSGKRVIHCSQFLGNKVTISTLEEILENYDFVP